MKLRLLCLLVLLLTVSPARADGLVPFEIVNSSVFFLPVIYDSYDLLNLGMFDPNQTELPGTVGFVLTGDPFTLTNNQLTFIPGSYDNGWLTITATSLCCADTFSLDGGVYVFTLPSTITPSTDTNDSFLWVRNVPTTVSRVPEPSSVLLLGLGLFALIIWRKWGNSPHWGWPRPLRKRGI